MNNIKKITIPSVFKEAWELLKDSKAAIWGIAILILLIAMTLEYITSQVIGTNAEKEPYFIRYILLPALSNLLLAPFYAGSVMVAIKRARGEPVDSKSGYQFFDRTIPVAITMVIVGFIANIMMMIVNIPILSHMLGKSLPLFDLVSLIFSFIVYAFFVLSVPMVIDKAYTPGQALSGSVMLIKNEWFKVFSIFIVAYCALFIISIPAFLGMIANNLALLFIGLLILVTALVWLFPFLILLIGVIYHRLVDQ